MRKLLVMCCLGILLLLTSCDAIAQTPPTQAVKLALTQQLLEKQQNLAQNLGLKSDGEAVPSFQVAHVTVRNRKKMPQKGFPDHILGEVYKIQGTFDVSWGTTADENVVQKSSPFELYLGTDPQDADADVATWFLIRPN